MLSIVSSLYAAVTTVCCCSVSPANSFLCVFVVVVCCCCSASPILSSLCVAAVVLFLNDVIKRHTVQNHQQLLHPDPTCQRGHTIYSKSKLSVEVARDDHCTFFCCCSGSRCFCTSFLFACPRQFDLSFNALDCCGDHPSADELCLDDLSSEASCAHLYIFTDDHVSMSRSIFFLSPCFAQENSVPFASFERSPLFKHLAYCQRTSQSDCPSFFFCCYFVFLLLRCCGCGRVGSGSCCCGVCVLPVCLCHPMHSRMYRVLLQLYLVLDYSQSLSPTRFTWYVFAVCLCCKMLVGTSPFVIENIPRPPPVVSFV